MPTIADGVMRVRDTCNVYVDPARAATPSDRLRQRRSCSTGSRSSASTGSPTCSSPTTTATRCRASARAAAAGIRIWVPPVEQELIAGVDAHWQAPPARERLRPPPGPLLAARAGADRRVPSPSTARRATAASSVYTLPTPGHTVGSVDLPRRARRPAPRLHRRPRLRRRARSGRSPRRSGRTPASRGRR